MRFQFIPAIILLTTMACQSDRSEKILANEVARPDSEQPVPAPQKPEQDGVEVDPKVPPAADTLLAANKVKIADPRQASGSTISLKKPVKANTKKASQATVDTPPKPAKSTETPKLSPADPSLSLSNTKANQEIVDQQPSDTPIYPSHAAFDALLRQYVTSAGMVNYSQLKQNEEKLNEYIETLKKSVPSSQWPRNEAKAYWLNAYNAFTLKLILQNWPVNSIMDLHGGKPWDVKWIELGDKTYSLNQIEHDIVRSVYKDPRIHFAVNCAAKSCPPLYNRAFSAGNLSSTLESLTRRFINGPYNEIENSPAKVSKIFEWYAEDFGDIRAYLNRYADPQLSADQPIEYKEYDWGLNGK